MFFDYFRLGGLRFVVSHPCRDKTASWMGHPRWLRSGRPPIEKQVLHSAYPTNDESFMGPQCATFSDCLAHQEAMVNPMMWEMRILLVWGGESVLAGYIGLLDIGGKDRRGGNFVEITIHQDKVGFVTGMSFPLRFSANSA